MIFGSPQRAKVKKKYPQMKSGKKLSEKLLVFCEFISQSYSFPLQKPLAKPVLVEFAN